MTTDGGDMTGGCLCGALRYRIDGQPRGDVVHCHCTLCRRASGAVAVTWLTVARGDFAWVAGTPALYRGSAKGAREFCATCGTPVTFRHADYADEIDISVGSLDRPEDAPASLHIWTGTRLPWLALDTHLPDREQE